MTPFDLGKVSDAALAARSPETREGDPAPAGSAALGAGAQEAVTEEVVSRALQAPVEIHQPTYDITSVSRALDGLWPTQQRQVMRAALEAVWPRPAPDAARDVPAERPLPSREEIARALCREQTRRNLDRPDDPANAALIKRAEDNIWSYYVSDADAVLALFPRDRVSPPVIS